ncbi:MAG: DUF4965 domain-containing protein, partial [Acidobacteriota bacterium]|nr:DUF4965 domain-containing protein [Acidobacteriota bacterium]
MSLAQPFLITFVSAVLSCGCWAQTLAPMRPPAVPLVAHDPYFSIWSMADHLSDNNTQHWTGKPNTLVALARIDGKTYQVMGRDAVPRGRQALPALDQKTLEVLPTRTIYVFSGSGIDLGLTFFTPALPDDLDVLSRPLTYIEWKASSNDGRPHDVSIYFDASGDLAVNTAEEPLLSSRYMLDGQPVLRIGSREQPILAKRGDDLRIDWGYLYLAADRPDGLTMSAMLRPDARTEFELSGQLPASDDFAERQPARRGVQDVIAATLNLGSVGTTPVQRYLMLAYDDLWAIEYFQRRERAWWRRNGDEAADLIRKARREHDALLRRSTAFDEELMADVRRIGGEEYSRLATLAYRQTLAAHKLIADVDGTPMFLPKENFSNGCIATVDVIYPSAPFTLLFSPRLLRAQLQPILDYAHMARWKWPFAPHDLGTYPQANGQVYGGGERTEENQMPVEESGNMLIMLAALARVEGNASFAERYWPEITKWAEYLKEKGLDPENQLSTDDFAGHLAHNANLSIKAILALASYGVMAEMLGHKQAAADYHNTARAFAQKWMGLAAEGDHYKLAFDQSGSWSQKYNLVWDKLLNLKIFPPEIARREIAFYQTKQNKYGLPLDNRKDYTKLDWILWTATLTDDPAAFKALV